MLVLQRTVGEQVQIGPGIVVTVLQSARGRIRVGVEAPEGMPVRRGELEPLPKPADRIGPQIAPQQHSASNAGEHPA